MPTKVGIHAFPSENKSWMPTCVGMTIKAAVPSGARGWTDAPAFDAIANRQSTTEKTLSLYIQQPHMHMLNTGRPPAEAPNIAAYIISLRKQ